MTAWPRAAFGSAVRCWLTGAVVVSAVIALSLAAQLIVTDADGWVEFLAFMVAWLGVVFWGGAGVIAAVTTPLRRRSPSIDGIVAGLLVALLVTGVGLWAWLLAIVPWGL